MIAAVVLAAGTSSRMGRPKQTVRVGGVPMLERVLKNYRESRVERVVVVIGGHADEVRSAVSFRDEVVVANPRFAEGMSSSLRLGIRHVGDADAAIIALGDQPFVRTSTINRIVSAYESWGARIVVPTYRGDRGNPVLFDRALFPQLGRIRGDVGAKSVVQRNAKDVLEVEVRDGGILADIDTPSDLEQWPRFRPSRSREGT